MQANTGIKRDWHDAALNLAYEPRIDVLIVQEPYVDKDLSKRKTPKHPAYQTFVPIETWDKRPRVVTYVKNHPQIRAHKLAGPWIPNRDMLLLQVTAWGTQTRILNIYNAPSGAEDPGQGISYTPGVDGIPNAVIKKGWRLIKDPVVRLYKACAKVGWHPTAFKEALLVAIPKPRKDPTLPRSYRPIALLSTLGKGLERVFAKRF
ncbi:hypothetical protein VTN31DRAFT_1331 [Thermomyces dupontii]|uniref:uncharacterized protein n=1 Tax=Talaromyces thermophilus TaxID=28565 RepID=UPI003744114C